MLKPTYVNNVTPSQHAHTFHGSKPEHQQDVVHTFCDPKWPGANFFPLPSIHDIDDQLRKREQWAVKLRNERKQKILAERRSKYRPRDLCKPRATLDEITKADVCPNFVASTCNHFQDRIDILEETLETYIAAFSKLQLDTDHPVAL